VYAIAADVITGMAAVESITKPVNLKRFIADVGIERYRFLAEVAHDRNVIFCKSSERTTKRLNMIENIEKKKYRSYICYSRIKGYIG